MQTTLNSNETAIPANALTVQQFLNAAKKPIVDAFKNCQFTVYGDVEKVTPWNGAYYITLIEKADRYNFNLKVFIPTVTAKRINVEIKANAKLLVIGSVTLNRNELQINATWYEDIGIGKLARQIQEWRVKYEPIFNRVKKSLPLICESIAVISNPNIQGFGDFLKHLKYGKLTVYERKMQGDGTASGVAEAINEINKSGLDFDCVVVLRGGGSQTDLFEFNMPAIIETIAQSKIPVCSAIGHEFDWPLIDFAADVRFSTPTDAGKQLTQRVINARQNIVNSMTAIQHSMRLRIKAERNEIRLFIEGVVNAWKQKVKDVRSQIKKARDSVRDAAINLVRTKRQVVLHEKQFVGRITKNIIDNRRGLIYVHKNRINDSYKAYIEQSRLKVNHRRTLIIAAGVVIVLAIIIVILLLRR